MDAYLRRLLASPPLSREREHTLALQARAGDASSRALLIEESMRLVGLHACRLRVARDDQADAVQSGSVGLIQAVDRFDPSRGVRLATYAWPWIQSAMVHGLEAGRSPGLSLLDPADRLPVEPMADLDELLSEVPEEFRSVAASRWGSDPSEGVTRTRSEVADQLGLTVSQVRTREAKAVTHLRSRLAKVGHRASPEGEADPL